VNVVAPGYICTDSQLPFEAAAAAAGPIGRSGTPAEIAACVLFLAHESASFVTGTVVVADGGHGLPETWPRPEFTAAPRFTDEKSERAALLDHRWGHVQEQVARWRSHRLPEGL